MTIRELGKEDAEAVEAIYDLYWSGEFRENLSARLRGFLDSSPDVTRQGFKYFVLEEEGEVVGVAALRKAPAHMKDYAHTPNPVEFYVSAVKHKGKGIGTMLRAHRIEEAKKLGYTEALFFSGETHKDSWEFHDHSDFKRISQVTAPNGEVGYIWGMGLK